MTSPRLPGRIQGQVTDELGGAVEACAVIVDSDGYGRAYPTDSSGMYDVPLIGGTYKIFYDDCRGGSHDERVALDA